MRPRKRRSRRSRRNQAELSGKPPGGPSDRARDGAGRKWIQLTLGAAVAILIAVAVAYVLQTRQGSADTESNTRTATQTDKSNRLFIAGADAGYVDAGTCVTCHADIGKTYRRTGMGRSFYRPRPENTVEDYNDNNTYYHKASDRYYTMYQRDGKYYQRRHQIGPDGQETNVIEKEIHFVLGSGNHGRTYLHRTREHKLVELPLAWYSEDGGHWAMNPGYDHPNHDGFRREIRHDCMFCHNGYPQIQPGSDTYGQEPVFAGKIPEGIDCQRCHGPGRNHVDAAQAEGETPIAIRDSIVNPARLSSERQLEVCMQCHLETTSRRLPYAIRRYDRGVFSYQPGEPLVDYMLHFDESSGAEEDRFEIAHAAYRLRKSACFEQSGGTLTCTTCHNPHDVPRGEEAAANYIRVCRTCHGASFQSLVAAESHTASQDCLGCHMPKRRTEDAVHVVMTDHYIQRRKPARNLLAPLEEAGDGEAAPRGEVVLYYPPQLPPGPEAELYLAVAQVAGGANLEAGIPRLERVLREKQPEQAEFYYELAEAYRKTNQIPKAIRWYEEALQRRPDFLPAVHNLGVSLGRSGQLSRAADLLQRALAIEPGHALTLVDLGTVYLYQGRPGDAARVLREALSIDPDRPVAHNSLGVALLRRQDLAGAQAAFQNAVRVQPDYAEAHYNLGNILTTQGDSDRAIWHYRQAIRAEPELADAHFELAAEQATRGNYQEAKRHFKSAVKFDPNHYAAHLNLGNILAAEGIFSEALSHLHQAAESSEPAVRQPAVEAIEKITGRPPSPQADPLAQ